MKRNTLWTALFMTTAFLAVGCGQKTPTESAVSTTVAETAASTSAPAAETPAAEGTEGTEKEESEKAAEGSSGLSSEWSGLPAEVMTEGYAIDKEAVAAQEITLGFSQCTMDHPYRVDMVEKAQKWCDENGVKLIVMDGQGEASNEVSNIESLIAKKVDAIIISSHGGVALTPAIAQANAAKIPIFLLDGGKPYDNWDFVTWMSTDDWALGSMTAEMLVEDLGGEGKICMLEATSGSSCQIGRRGGFLEVVEKEPKIQIVAEQDANMLRKNAMDIAANILQADPDLDAFYCHNDEMALGAIEAIEKAGLKPGEDIKVYSSCDFQANAFEAIKAGKLENTFFYAGDGGFACNVATAYLTGTEVAHMINLGTQVCTKENVDTCTPAY